MNSLLVVLSLAYIATTAVCQDTPKVDILGEAKDNVTEAAIMVQNLLEAGDLPDVGAIFVTGLADISLTSVLQELVEYLLVTPGIIVDAFVAAVSQAYAAATPAAQTDLEQFMVSVISNITSNATGFISTPIAELTSDTFTGINPILKTLIADSMTDVAEMEGCGGVGPLLEAGMMASGELEQLYNATLAQQPTLSECY